MDDLEDCMNQVYRMALASMQSFTFWLHTDPDKTIHEDVLKEFGHFFYATHEAHVTMMVISLDCLYDEKKSLLNFTKLIGMLPSTIEAAKLDRIKKDFDALLKNFKGVKLIRNHSFGHVANYQTRMKIGEKWEPNIGELMELCYGTLVLATNIGRMLGRDLFSAEEVSALDLETFEKMMARLRQPVEAGGSEEALPGHEPSV